MFSLSLPNGFALSLDLAAVPSAAWLALAACVVAAVVCRRVSPGREG